MVDGGVAKNDFILQQIADLTSLPVVRGRNVEMSAWGVASLAGLVAGMWDRDKLEEMRNLIHVNEKIRAVGEIGLDAGHEDRCKFEDQEKTFRKCLEMAVEMDKPICLHVKGRMEVRSLILVLQPQIN